MIGGRSLDRIVQVAAPIVATTVLAAAVLITVPPTANSRVPNGAVPLDPGEVVALALLPNPDIDQIVALAEGATDRKTSCTGPWTAGKVLNWACRTADVLVIFRGRGRTTVEELDMTWFGFDSARSVLPAWAAAAAGLPAEAERIAAWAREAAGSNATTTIGSIKLVAGGSRGAVSLVVAGLACDSGLAPSHPGARC